MKTTIIRATSYAAVLIATVGVVYFATRGDASPAPHPSRQRHQPRLRILHAFDALESREREGLRAHRNEDGVVECRQRIGPRRALDVHQPREPQVAQQLLVVQLLDAKIADARLTRLPLASRQGPAAMAQAEDAEAHAEGPYKYTVL